MANSIVFPADPFEPRKVDEEFRHEANVVEELGGKVVLVDHTELESGSFVGKNVLTKAKASEYSNFMTDESRENLYQMFPASAVFAKNAFYRGWMLSQDAYELMYSELSARTISMLTHPRDYMAGYWISGWYDYFRDFTPSSLFMSVEEFESSMRSGDFAPQVQSQLGSGSYIVKDQVKSRKSEWDTACFAPNHEKLPEIAREFLRLQGDYLAGGLVFREFEEFDKVVGETRVWWVNNEPVFQSPHPDNLDSYMPVDVYFLRDSVNAFNRPFITTDLALRKDGTWRVMEVSDGQVSGTPKGFDVNQLFKALLAA